MPDLSRGDASDPVRWVLVVDDDPAVVGTVIQVVTRRYANVRCLGASRLAEARRRLRQYPVDVVLTDHRLPRGTGMDVLHEAARQVPAPRRIMMTSFPDAVSAGTAASQGLIEGYLVKPFRAAQLVELLDIVLHACHDPQRRRLRRLLARSVLDLRPGAECQPGAPKAPEPVQGAAPAPGRTCRRPSK